MAPLVYTVKFNMKKVCGEGESLCVLGSLPELGVWKEFKHHLKMTGDNVWESVKPLVTR